MRLTTYARPQMQHLGIQSDGKVNIDYGIRNVVMASLGVDVTSKGGYNLVGPIYKEGDYQPVVTGKAKIGESTESAIRREIFEEVGFTNCTIIPYPPNPRFPDWAFAIAIRGKSSPATTLPPIDERKDDYKRRIMVALLHPVSGEPPLTPENHENITGLALTPLRSNKN